MMGPNNQQEAAKARFTIHKASKHAGSIQLHRLLLLNASPKIPRIIAGTQAQPTTELLLRVERGGRWC
jgi:hypothetical protein